MYRHHSLNAFLRRRFAQRVQKIPLDAGYSCPNRDGSKSRKGCIFCNPSGSGSGLLSQGLSIAEQWEHWKERLAKRYGATVFMAYLQSYSNTYGTIDQVRATLEQLNGLPQMVAVSIGTRPDCIDAEKIELLAGLSEKLGPGTVFLELGLQSSDPQTLETINRGHTPEEFARAASMAAKAGLEVVAHVIAGLPRGKGRESAEDLVHTVRFVNSLPVGGIKFHNLYVCDGTPLGALWRSGGYDPMTLEEYLHALGEALMELPPETVVHRLNGNPAPGELLAPAWADDGRALHDAIRKHFDANDIWQGKRNGAPDGPPAWYDPAWKPKTEDNS